MEYLQNVLPNLPDETRFLTLFEYRFGTAKHMVLFIDHKLVYVKYIYRSELRTIMNHSGDTKRERVHLVIV